MIQEPDISVKYLGVQSSGAGRILDFKTKLKNKFLHLETLTTKYEGK